MSTSTATKTYMAPDYTLSHAHGTVMVIAWMMFASTGILFARYGRVLHIGKRAKILGEHIWFQIHRLALVIAAFATLLGFFLILAQAGGQWVSASDQRLLAHSILGVIIVCCTQIQICMAIFRCHPTHRFRFIFNWMHRLTGLSAFLLSIPTIFLIAFVLPKYQTGLVTILSLWSAWVVIIVIIFELIEYHCQKTLILSMDSKKNNEITDINQPHNVEMDSIDHSNTQYFNRIKTIFFCIHIIIAIGLAIPLIALIWLQG